MLLKQTLRSQCRPHNSAFCCAWIIVKPEQKARYQLGIGKKVGPVCDTIGNEKTSFLLLIELSDKSLQPDSSSSAGSCTHYPSLLCVICVQFTLNLILFVFMLRLREPLRFVLLELKFIYVLRHWRFLQKWKCLKFSINFHSSHSLTHTYDNVGNVWKLRKRANVQVIPWPEVAGQARRENLATIFPKRRGWRREVSGNWKWEKTCGNWQSFQLRT